MITFGSIARIGLCTCVAFVQPVIGWAQASYPARPVTLIVGFTAGGPADVVARTIGPALSTALGTPIVIENKPGADGTIAAAQVARATADGYTILLAPSTHTINSSLYKKLPYNPINSFLPIALIGDSPNILAVHPSVPAKNVSEFISYAKRSNPEPNYGSTSSVTDLATELFSLTAGIKMQRVPYKGAGQAMPALLAGDVQVMVSSLLTMLPQVNAGRVRALAVTSSARTDAAPNIPTVAESGLPDYVASTWYGLFAPAGVPKSVALQLSRALNKALEDKDVRAKFASQGLTNIPNLDNPEAFAAFVETETEKWRRVVQAAGLSVE